MKKKYNSLAEMVGKKPVPADDYQFKPAEVDAKALKNPVPGTSVQNGEGMHANAAESREETK